MVGGVGSLVYRTLSWEEATSFVGEGVDDGFLGRHTCLKIIGEVVVVVVEMVWNIRLFCKVYMYVGEYIYGYIWVIYVYIYI